MQHSFNVDLRGIVDLLSHHLYSSPRVYVRELLQNSVDSITARRLVAGAAPARIRIEPRETTVDGSLRIHDTGIGLTEPQVHELLATIGNSSKRDELGFARHDFLGQFGIGLLSCFLVADEIEVITRSGDAETVIWRGHADGHYTVHRAIGEHGPAREEPGTTVILRARRDCEHWLGASTVTELVRHYGALLPYDVRVGEELVTEGTPPWRVEHPSPDARRDALLRYGERLIGTAPFDVIDLAVPEAGLSGAAFVLPHETNPGERAFHRVYLKRMLLGDRVEKIMPDWAFFVRCVIDTDGLRPTASREQLHEDDLLTSTREALGGQLRGWLVRLAATSPERLSAFLRVHHLGVMALALHDVEMLRIVDEWLPFETSEGPVSLGEFRRRHRTIHYTPNIEEFRQLAGIAAAQGMGLVNGAYTYHADILRRLRRIDPDLVVRRLDPDDLATRFVALDPAAEFAARDFVGIARTTLASRGCEPVLRSFSPASLPVLYLEGRDGRLAADMRAAREEADGVWAELLEAGDPEEDEQARPLLVFNYRNPLVARLTTTVDAGVVELSTEALYGYAMLAGNRPLGPDAVAGVNRAFLGLVEHAVHAGRRI
ncbi:HSP90 family protein [Actinomadura sp. HBU206391]|uniref:HSP90 family protein n=1 Tax=Actinomadura sp. HBU206391 TaxID=2731692 RepID=UPI001650C26C|nr:HSP90 family protein [Actinomadura sp. HBU206391]MBC6459202.1 HSP90 family protein [Actinomadura sp. HBU206391]